MNPRSMFEYLENDVSFALRALGAFFVALFICFLLLITSIRRRQASPRPSEIKGPISPGTNLSFPILTAQDLVASAKKQLANTDLEELQHFKELFFKVQNLEEYPDILPQAREALVSLLSETLASACQRPDSGILSLGTYSRESLATFLKKEDDDTYTRWEDYLARRKAGSPTELFANKKGAEWWVKQLTPVKYVDGAWLGHINRATTPYALRRITKDAWQVLSEELGDGDLEKNHVQVYHQLIKTIDPSLPEGDAADFIHPQHGMNQIGVWKAAVAQLVISLFPHDFLPEILGFNMQFEAITLQTLKAAKELKEVKLDPYYFILHISIDNADSGHTAIAMQTVVNYINHIQQTQGEAAAQRSWKRIQAGYILSSGLPANPYGPGCQESEAFPRSEQEAAVIKIFQAKALVAHKIHCPSGVKIGHRTLSDWLEPGALASKQDQMRFLDDLGNSKPWIRKGDSKGSKLMQELAWGGKMFGSFTQAEVTVVQQWIESLGRVQLDPRLYWSFVERTETCLEANLRGRDIRTDYPVLSPRSSYDFSTQAMLSLSDPPLSLPALTFTVTESQRPKLDQLLPIWFTHPCLLESFIGVPSKTTTITVSAVLRLLRAQSGFSAEGDGVAGMDEVRRTESVGLVELGLEMVRRCGLPEPTCLPDVLDEWPSEFALTMLHSAMFPTRNASFLLGLAYSFVVLHDIIAAAASAATAAPCSPSASVAPTLLSPASAETLRHIARRERDSLAVCWEELLKHSSQLQHQSFCTGFYLGSSEIQKCFSVPGND